jgi:alpha-glucoside transport system permease protein
MLMRPSLEEMRTLALEAGKILKSGYGKSHDIVFKGITDLVTEVDRRSEDMLVAYIQKHFPGRRIIFIVVVALLVVPLQLALVPILQDYTKLDLNGTYLAVWLAHTGFGLPLAIYLMFNYIGGLPRDILESAFIDGASHFTIFTRLILPLSIPALASFAIFQFLWVWNDYLVALVFLGDKTRVVTSALAAMVGEKGQDWHFLTSGAFISMILPLVVFFALQRYFVRGLLAGSVKG